MAFAETQLYWPGREWHLKETCLHPSEGLLQQIPFNRQTNITCAGQRPWSIFPNIRAELVCVHPNVLSLICAMMGLFVHVQGRVLVRCVFCRALYDPPEWQPSFIWETPPLSSISCCLCSSLCVSLSCWLGCIMWLMSSGQSAVGTRTRSGDPEADWRRANGEDAATSGGARCQTGPVNYASRSCWNQPPSAHVASKQAEKFTSNAILLVWVHVCVGMGGCMCVRTPTWVWEFRPSGVMLSCLSAHCVNIREEDT